MNRNLIVIASALACAAPASAQRLPININAMGVNMRAESGNGVCAIAIPEKVGEPRMLMFNIRPSDGNLVAAVLTPGEVFDGKDLTRDIPMTLIFDGKKKTTSKFGEYKQGYWRLVRGGWGPGKTSDDAFALLKDAKEVSVKFDGMSFGPFNTQMKGFAYNWLVNCIAQEKNPS